MIVAGRSGLRTINLYAPVTSCRPQILSRRSVTGYFLFFARIVLA